MTRLRNSNFIRTFCFLLTLSFFGISCTSDFSETNLNKSSKDLDSRSSNISEDNIEILLDVFANIDFEYIKTINSDEELLSYLSPFNEYMYDYFKIFRNELEIPVEAINGTELFQFAAIHIVSHFTEVVVNANGETILVQSGVNDELVKCILEVIGGYFTIETLVADYILLLEQGATWNTIWPIMKNLIRRYVGWFLIASLLWDISENCNLVLHWDDPEVFDFWPIWRR